MDKVPVFISYHGADYTLAKQIKTSLKRLSDDFDVFLDRESNQLGGDYEEKIAKEIARAEWFLIVCTGLPRRDADMLESFYEAGQFRATLPQRLTGEEADKRIVTLFDTAPPAMLARFQGVRVDGHQLNRSSINMDDPPANENTQFDNTAIFRLLKDMLDNKGGTPLRDTNSDDINGLIREESKKIITSFENSTSVYLRETTLQPRIAYELQLGGSLTDDTEVRGFDGSLRNLFSIDPETTTWRSIVSICSRKNGSKPVWLSAVEASAKVIGAGEVPDLLSQKCFLKGVVYRVFTSRF